MLVAVVVATLAGMVAGALIARRVMRPVDPGSGALAPARQSAEQDDRQGERDDGAAGGIAGGLREAVDRLPIGVVLCDAAAATTYRNEAAGALAGTHGGVILDHHLHHIFTETQVGTPSSRVIELQGPPKTTFAIEALPIPGGGAVATIEDITERVRIDSMRTDFVANISHELKTPVGAIAVLAEMLTDEPDPKVIATLSERVVDESHRAARTIDGLLELSRIESSRTIDDVVDLGSVIDEAVARGRMIAEHRGVEITLRDSLTAPHLRADRPQLVSAIGNLVENAVKYSDDGGVVQIQTRRNERWVEVMVVDQGDGIPSADLDRVFERFYRVDKARARGTGGNGLGLAIVRHVMQNHGGDVSVSSQVGDGSTFVARLPARLVVEDPASTCPASSAESEVAQ